MFLYLSLFTCLRSEEIRYSALRRNHLMFLLVFCENLRFSLQVLVESQNCSYVTAPIAVVGSRPNGNNDIPFEHVLVALLDQLVSSADQIELVNMSKLFSYVFPKQPPGTSRTDAPCIHILSNRGKYTAHIEAFNDARNSTRFLVVF